MRNFRILLLSSCQICPPQLCLKSRVSCRIFRFFSIYLFEPYDFIPDMNGHNSHIL